MKGDQKKKETAAGSVSCFVIIDFCFDWEPNWARGRAWKMSKSLGWIAWVDAAITNHFLIANLKLLVIYSQPIEKPTHIKDPQPFAWLMINQVNQIVLICTNTIIIVGKENQSFINTLHKSMVNNGSILKFNSILISKFTRLVLLALMTETWKNLFSCALVVIPTIS